MRRQFQWAGVGRVLIMPFDNETAFPHAPDEVRNALATELQRLGLFEVVPAPPQLPTEVSRVIRENGRFNEVALVQPARLFRADLIVMGTVTQYNPYASLPRLGLVLQVVSPGDGVVVASVDGMWDAASAPVAQRAQAFYRQYTKPSEVPFTAALVLESPRLFQRFVCFEAAQVLVPPPPRPPACCARGGFGPGTRAGAGTAAAAAADSRPADSGRTDDGRAGAALTARTARCPIRR